MKFTILSHAGLLVEDQGRSILFDPWLIGSCYWRSWWNFPEVDRKLIDSIKPDYIYLTHLHWDHFHSISLRLFDKDTKFLVPKIPSSRMVRDLKSIKRTNITEIPHGGEFELWKGCILHSYQFGVFAADSAAIISDGETTLLNANDCKVFGLPLRQITDRFPKIDFCFRSHSSATPIPYCIKDYKDKFPELRSQQSYIEEFTEFSHALGAKYAIPFASNHCFLHKETVKFNETGVDPQMVADFYNSNLSAKSAESECVVMSPGSSWSREEGFSVRAFDYNEKDRVVAELQLKYKDKYDKQYEKEDQARASFKAFERYFTGMLMNTPLLLRKFVLPRVLFKAAESDGEKSFLIDFPNSQIAEVDGETTADIIIRVPAIVLNDCARRKMFSVWGASKRLEIEMEAKHMSKLNVFMACLDFYENEGFPLRNNLSARNIGIWLRRWREGMEAVLLVFRHKILRQKFVISELYKRKD